MRIVILGGGYGGLTLARRLAWWLKGCAGHSLALVECNDAHQLIVRLHEVSAASIAPDEALVPYARALQGTGVEFCQARVTAIEVSRGRIGTSAGDLPYDILVVALGSEPEYFGLPGLRDHALPFRTWGDAVRLARHVEHQVVRARRERDSGRRQAHLTVAIGGGGDTGVELAGEMADRLRELVRLHEIRDPWRIVLLEAQDQLLPGLPPSVRERALDALGQRGVEVRLGSAVTGARPGEVLVAGGEAVAAGTLVWTGGVRASALVAASRLATGAGGRARVDACLRCHGLENVFAVGDCAVVTHPETEEALRPSAQLAIQQADHAARNVYRLLTGRRLLPFAGRVAAEVISLGRRDAVALLGGVVVSGPDARALKHLSYRRYLRSIGA